ncbi:MAG: VWA domain-containing protein [Chloroflexota bacterium]|nr:VWA domain-containing protein [Dehalococcoidia bacterium]MDW8254561.1 VWA domain-containing protein [Chloroflexota bacterium]
MGFSWPLALLGLLVIPLLIATYILLQRRRTRYAVRFTNLALLKEVAPRAPGWRRHIPAALFLLAVTAMILALARPHLEVPVPIEQSYVMLAIDTSRSMEANDMQPTRMEAAKEAAKQFVSSLPKTARVGVVSFSDRAVINLPPTDDHKIVIETIDKLGTQAATAIGEGIMASLSVLPGGELAQQRPGNPSSPANPPSRGGQPQRPPANVPSTIVLLSDGASNRGISPLQAAREAKERNVKVYTIGIGTREGGTVISGGQVLRVYLDEATLRRIAEITEAEYFFAPNERDLARVYKSLGSTVGWERQQTEVTAGVTAAALILSLAGGLLSLLWFNRLP